MQDQIRQEKILGSRRFSNYFWATLLLIGGLMFLLAGISSYLKINLLPFANTTELVFIPQGIVMMFYGTLSFGLSIYIIATLFWASSTARMAFSIFPFGCGSVQRAAGRAFSSNELLVCVRQAA